MDGPEQMAADPLALTGRLVRYLGPIVGVLVRADGITVRQAAG